MAAIPTDVCDRTYAGVLGKLVGVYLGRAVEGWSYEAIRQRFGTIDYYVHDKVGWPLIVPDDDISGTFLFFRALEDNGFPADIAPAPIGDTWLNYIVEDKTVLWWGGLGRSTEHTAYLRLKSGVPAPDSGSARLNGTAMAEQIGAEIFIDAWAMANPDDPDRAAAMARAAASVSHDGVAVEAAVLLAAMQAAAYSEHRIAALIETGLHYCRSNMLHDAIGALIDECARADGDWRRVRGWLGDNHGYERYPGNCPMVPNHLLLLASFILGGDDFQKGLSIAVSSGWDTDCNAGNLGALNGIRLGLDAFRTGPDFRTPVADRLFLVNADGGECLTDAVVQTRKILTAQAQLGDLDYQAPSARFAFELPGSVQGFVPCPLHDGIQAVTEVGNLNEDGGPDGLRIAYRNLARGVEGAVSVATFIDPVPRGAKDTSYFEVIAAPALYPTQTVRAELLAPEHDIPTVRFAIHHFDGGGDLRRIDGPPLTLQPGRNSVAWEVPDTGGLPICRLGLTLSSEQRASGAIGLLSLDWSGAPRAFRMGSAKDLSPTLTPWDTATIWTRSFVSSAKHFATDIYYTFALSHPDDNGVATTGTRDWVDYAVMSDLVLDLYRTVGLVARARGHRRYYAGVIQDGFARVVLRWDNRFRVLAERPFAPAPNSQQRFVLSVAGRTVTLRIGEKMTLTAEDGSIASGGAGFLIEGGTVPALGFAVERVGGDEKHPR